MSSTVALRVVVIIKQMLPEAGFVGKTPKTAVQRLAALRTVRCNLSGAGAASLARCACMTPSRVVKVPTTSFLMFLTSSFSSAQRLRSAAPTRCARERPLERFVARLHRGRLGQAKDLRHTVKSHSVASSGTNTGCINSNGSVMCGEYPILEYHCRRKVLLGCVQWRGVSNSRRIV
jgi:hypothetical protein